VGIVTGIFKLVLYYLSSPPQILRFPVVRLERRGLIFYSDRRTVYNIIAHCTNKGREVGGGRWEREGAQSPKIKLGTIGVLTLTPE
jgi:hypothetical protein